MDSIDVTRLSSKGQIVIPFDVRTTLGLAAGTRFVVYGQGDTIFLKRIGKPSREENRRLLADSRKLARTSRLKKGTLGQVVAKVRETQ